MTALLEEGIVVAVRQPVPWADGRTADGGPTADSDLLAATAAGDRDALAELYRRHAPWLLLRLGRRCPDRDLVDEVLQDTFVAVWRGAGRWDGSGEVAAWVWGIAVRRLVDAQRRQPAPTTELPDTIGTEPSAEERVLHGVQYTDIGGALNRLSPELRSVVQATVIDGLTTREAGKLLGLPAGTVKTRMMRARAQLREAVV
jgi:RNA polymerase sigma-70 factor (ECF subfamily)